MVTDAHVPYIFYLPSFGRHVLYVYAFHTYVWVSRISLLIWILAHLEARFKMKMMLMSVVLVSLDIMMPMGWPRYSGYRNLTTTLPNT